MQVVERYVMIRHEVKTMEDDLINCGERKVQREKRISLRDILDRYHVNEGDAIEVFIKIKKAD